MMLTVDEPRANLTEQGVEAAMQEIISSDVFEVNGSLLATAHNARIIERNVMELINA